MVIALLLTILSERTNVNELMVAAGGHKFLVLGQRVLGRRKMYEMSLPKVRIIGAVTYNSLRGKYFIIILHWKIYERSYDCSYKIQRIHSAIATHSFFQVLEMQWV
jgi:hypothetical protein